MCAGLATTPTNIYLIYSRGYISANDQINRTTEIDEPKKYVYDVKENTN